MSYKKCFLVLSVFVLTVMLGLFVRYSEVGRCFSPKIVFEKRSYDFGQIKIGVSVRTYFVYTNAGFFPLTINGVVTSCECTTFDFNKKSLSRGEKDSILVVFDASKSYNFLQQLFVYSNSGRTVSDLIITGDCIDTIIK